MNAADFEADKNKNKIFSLLVNSQQISGHPLFRGYLYSRDTCLGLESVP